MDIHLTQYRKCDLCKQSYAQRYFARHECNVVDDNVTIDVNSVNTNEEGRIESDITNNSNVPDFVLPIEEEEMRFGGLENETLQEDIFDELFQEAYLTENEEDCDQNIKSSVFVRWLCLFLAYWQRSFNITDNALAFLIKFLALFLDILINEKDDADAPVNYTSLPFPKTLYSFRKYLNIDKTCYVKYAVCPSCHTLYSINDCLTKHGGVIDSKRCSYVKFPNHPQIHNRSQCGHPLMKKIISTAGKVMFFPYKIYCYRPVQSTLKNLLVRPGFEESCEKWRSRADTNLLMDIYDGNVWKNFKIDGANFFSQVRNYGLMLNVDWFQPYKHISSFSIGAIYIVLLNLPRHLRFKRKNIFLVGIIPNMIKEPPLNTFLTPLVDELDSAWKEGFLIQSLVSRKKEIFRLALVCVGCDIPASRKLCGFLGHSAVRGCSRCEKLFPGPIGARDYSGFRLDTWEMRTTESHRQQMYDIVSANTAQERNRLESMFGTRFSVLAFLPYFDTIKMTIIDPMHNLFLGTGKHILKIWRELGYLNKQNLEKLQERVDCFTLPHDVGKIPRKIVSSFDGFNADEYKNWVLLFSLYSLHGIIPKRDLECFRKFVIACSYLCRKTISRNDLEVAHNFLLQFCIKFEELYGNNRVTPNIHLHMHLKDCISDFGPIYGFWLFSFERYNGMLGEIPTNKKDIELQIMRRFCSENMILNLPFPKQFEHAFKGIFVEMENFRSQRGTLQDIESDTLLELIKLSSRSTNVSSQLWHIHDNLISYCSKKSVASLSPFESETLKQVYTYLYPNLNFDNVIFPRSYEKCSELYIGDMRYGSSFSKNSRSSFIMAFWSKSNGLIGEYDEQELKPRPGIIRYFLKHSLIIDNNCFEHWFAYCEWFYPVIDNIRYRFGKPLEVWNRALFEQFGPSTYIPVQRIQSKFVHVPFSIQSKDLMVVIPRLSSSSI